VEKRTQAAKKTAKSALNDTALGQPNEAPLESAGEIVVTHFAVPPEHSLRNKQIHPRRPLPPVPDSPRAENDPAKK
jgi:hypothetical protein